LYDKDHIKEEVTLLELFIFFLILIALPCLNYISVKKIKSINGGEAKELGYWLIYLTYWIITIPILFLHPFQDIYYPKYILTFNPLSNVLIWILIAYMLFTVVIPILVLPLIKQLRQKVAESYDDKLYPVTKKQQIMFVLVSITVGICEEIIFRGFLYNYLQDFFFLSASVSLIVVSVVFGLGHFMQGISGVISSTIFGLIMGYLYFVTGSLLVPIIVHILYDAKAIYITRVLQKSS
jgi:membrane protease YdiL (CAAX protease family)